MSHISFFQKFGIDTGETLQLRLGLLNNNNKNSLND